MKKLLLALSLWAAALIPSSAQKVSDLPAHGGTFTDTDLLLYTDLSEGAGLKSVKLLWGNLRNQVLESGLSTAADIDLHSPGDVILTFGDAAGVNELRILDSGAAILATINSDGDFEFGGTGASATIFGTAAAGEVFAEGSFRVVDGSHVTRVQLHPVGLFMNSATGLIWYDQTTRVAGADDVFIYRQNAAGQLALHGVGADAKFYIHSDDSDVNINPTNFEAGTLTTDTSGNFTIAAEILGTGTANGNIILLPNGTGVVNVTGEIQSTVGFGLGDAASVHGMGLSGDDTFIRGGNIFLQDTGGASTYVTIEDNTGNVIVTGAVSSVDGAATIADAATTFAVTSNLATVVGDAGGDEVIATITGGSVGMELTIICVDALWTLTDDDTHAADSTDLSAAFSAADDTTLTLIHNGTSWYEKSRSVN